MATRVDDPPRIVIRSVGWTSGINIRDALPQLTPDEARIMENGTLDERGAFQKRLGCLSHGTFGSAGDRVLSMYVFHRGEQAPQMLLQTTAGVLYYTNDPMANPIVWNTAATGLATNAPFSYETFLGFCYMANGVDVLKRWDGAAMTDLPSAPKGKYLRLWKDTMWLSGVPGLPDRVYESAAGDADTWPVAGWVDIGKGDGDFITGLSTDGLMLIVFKQNRHMVIFDPVTTSNRVVDFEKGCESHNSVVQFEGEILFLSRRGICRYLGDAPSEIISGRMDPLFDQDVINLRALNRVAAYTIPNQVGWALPEDSSMVPTVQLEYYPRLAGSTAFGGRGVGPFVFHRMPASMFARWRWDDNDVLFSNKVGTNTILELFADTGTDDGTAFAATLQTGTFDFGQPNRTKYIRRLRFYGRGLVTCTVRRNFQTQVYKSFFLEMSSGEDTWDVTDTWNVGIWGPDELFKEALINPDVYGRHFQLTFVDAQTATSHKTLPVGSVEYKLEAGSWALHQYTADGDLLGVRD